MWVPTSCSSFEIIKPRISNFHKISQKVKNFRCHEQPLNNIQFRKFFFTVRFYAISHKINNYASNFEEKIFFPVLM